MCVGLQEPAAPADHLLWARALPRQATRPGQLSHLQLGWRRLARVRASLRTARALQLQLGCVCIDRTRRRCCCRPQDTCTCTLADMLGCPMGDHWPPMRHAGRSCQRPRARRPWLWQRKKQQSQGLPLRRRPGREDLPLLQPRRSQRQQLAVHVAAGNGAAAQPARRRRRGSRTPQQRQQRRLSGPGGAAGRCDRKLKDPPPPRHLALGVSPVMSASATLRVHGGAAPVMLHLALGAAPHHAPALLSKKGDPSSPLNTYQCSAALYFTLHPSPVMSASASLRVHGGRSTRHAAPRAGSGAAPCPGTAFQKKGPQFTIKYI